MSMESAQTYLRDVECIVINKGFHHAAWSYDLSNYLWTCGLISFIHL